MNNNNNIWDKKKTTSLVLLHRSLTVSVFLDNVINSTNRCCVRLSVRLLPCWILGRTRGSDGGLELSQGMREGQLGAEDQAQVREVLLPVSSAGLFK